MNKTIAIWIGVFAVTFGVLFVLIKHSASRPVKTDYPEANVIAATDHTSGNAVAKSHLIEYGDFQCPGCGQVEPFVEQIRNDYKDKLLVIFRNFPLPGHAHAMLAAQYAEAAGLQGKYWEMHDAIYAHQTDWSKLGDAEPSFKGYAQDLKLDITRLARDIKSDAVTKKIQDDQTAQNKYGVDSTPTFFLNGKKIRPASFDEFRSLINAAIAAQG